MFVFPDNVEHSKRYPTRRTKILAGDGSNNSDWLTVPLKKSSDFTLIKDLIIDNSQPWQKSHLRKIKQVYQNTPFFQQYFPLIETYLLDAPVFSKLADLNIHLINNLCKLIGISSEFYNSSHLPVTGKGDEYNMGLVKYLDGTTYMSGMGAKKYQSEAAFMEQGIRLWYSGFGGWLESNPYIQIHGGVFIGGLSVLDALFHIGSTGIVEIFETYNKVGSLKC